jgi:hypothetical protein
MYCKPGKVRPLVEKFLAMSKLTEKMGMGKMRVMTDVSAEPYWTLVVEMEVPSLEAFEAMGRGRTAALAPARCPYSCSRSVRMPCRP